MTSQMTLTKVSYNPFSTTPVLIPTPTTASQREIWTTMQLDPESSLCFNEVLEVTLCGHVDEQVLLSALREVLSRHDALRSFFSSDGMQFFIRNEVSFELEKVDLSEEGDLPKLRRAQVTRKFDLSTGPCFRATLVKTSDQSHVLLLAVHHLVCDGWSFAVIINELSVIYSSLLNKRPIHLPPASQFTEVALQEARQGQNRQHLDYWLNLFRSHPKRYELPIDFKRPPFRTYDSGYLSHEIAPETVANIKQLAASKKCSFYTVLYATFAFLLGRITGSEELVIGMASASQSSLGKHDLVGHLVNLLPLPVRVPSTISFNDYLQTIKSRMLDAFDHQNVTFNSILKELNISRAPGEIPLVNTVFNIDQQSPGQGLEFEGLSGSYSTVPRVKENFELFFNAIICQDRLTLECQYNSNLFLAATICNWLEQYEELLTQVLRTPDKMMSSFHLPKLILPEIFNENHEIVRGELQWSPEIEVAIKEVWNKVLGQADLKSSDNFFVLGGHSLLAVEVVSLLKDKLRKEVSIKDVFECPTIAELAARLSGPLEQQESVTSILRTGATSAGPSHNQIQVWYVEELFPQTRVHNLPTSLRIKFKVDPEVLERTLHFMLKRHESLRTRIVTREGVPSQEVVTFEEVRERFRLETVSVSEEHLMSSMQSEADHLFEKEKAPLFRAKLFKLAEEDFSLFIMAHHAVWDGWCFDIFFEELDIIYSALLRNEIPRFNRDPEVSYIDYSLWFNENIRTGTFRRQLEYWQNQLCFPLPILELPTDHKRPLMAGHSGGSFRFNLSAQQMQQLRAYAQSRNSSIFNVMLTAFKITLARYSGQNDIIVGSPVRGRNRPEIMQTIGYFVNTVALRCRPNLAQSFEENLQMVTRTCLDAFANQDVPFETILNNISYHKDTSRTAIFQSFFTFQDMTNRRFSLDGKKIKQVSVSNASVKTDLDIWVRVTNEEIRGAFEYRRDLFDVETIEHFSQTFFHLLDGLHQNTGKALNELSILNPKQLDLVLNKWNDTVTDPVSLRPIHLAFEEMVGLYPEKVAIESDKGGLTYWELNRLSTVCAAGLIDQGVRPGDLVGISLNRSPELLIAVLGTLKAGAGYVPLDPGFPQRRLDYMVENSGIQVLISESLIAGRFKAPTKKIMMSEILAGATSSADEIKVDVTLDSTMYVIYTSGSTGNPKGVEVSHLAVANFLNSMKRAPGVVFEDKLLAVTTFSFDIAALELYLPLITGATIYLASSYDVIDGAALRGIIEEKKISIMQATPSTWRLLLSAGWKGDKKFKVLCGGEAFPKDLADKLLRLTGEVWNMYGPTETTIWSSCKKLGLQDETVSIGRPIDNTVIYVLDERLQHVPIGSAGELYIGGLGLARGYFGRHDLTAEKFVSDPYRRGQKIYATGDMGRFMVNGEIECLGRLDGQVKVRGYRIELLEIELALARTENVCESAAITMEVRPGDKRIIAFLVARQPEKKCSERQLRESLGRVLPQYMIPSHFVYLDELPKTLNGKIDKRNLPSRFKLEGEQSSIINREMPLATGLRRIWQDVLKKEMIDDQDNFFDLGGNSLLAVQLFSTISRHYALDLTLATLIAYPSFADFEAHVKSKLSSQGELRWTLPLPSGLSSLVSIRAGGSKNPIFCFHGVGGNVLNYIPLVNSVEPDRPFLALQCRGLDGSIPLLDSIESMASAYISEIKLVRPRGPYILAGGSMGGMIALEVAQQLLAAGEKIEKLIMFDTFGPDINIRSYDKSERSFLKNLKISLYYRRRAVVNKLIVKCLKFLHLPVPLEVRLFDTEMNNYRALWKYRPRKYAGDLHLIRAKQRREGWYSDPVMGWENTIDGKITTVEIDGKHGSFMEGPELGNALVSIL